MKRMIAILCALALLCGCAGGKADSAIKDGKTIAEVMDEVRAAYLEEYGVEEIIPMPMPVDRAYLSDLVGVETEDIADEAGWVSMSMTNSDAFFAVRAKDDRIDAVADALKDRVQALRAQYEVYPVMGSYERAQAAKVVVESDYAFLIVVGTGDGDYDDQVDFLIDEIRAHFN